MVAVISIKVSVNQDELNHKFNHGVHVMIYSSTRRPTLIQHIPWDSGLLRYALVALVGSCLLAVSAKVQVPFWPVPMTMQTFVVLVLAIACGPRLGAATVALYLVEGGAGLPIFANGGGLAYMMGPTGGYLVGFLASALVVGFLAERGWDRSMITTAAAMLIGEVVIFACGLAWLGQFTTYEKVVELGLTPFLLSEVFKILLATFTLPLLWKSLRS
ncbi:MAG: biotin transporter BioY [SAR324 cluster bacterium]|nr:biotin transporter BioY [SAR324 cluster bacterium]MDP7463006.1 biotin transporter BioY [SAR324 cluster bacterium]